MRGIHRSPVNSPHKGQWHRAFMFSLICAWTNGWVNNREAAGLRRHRTHYDVILVCCWYRHCISVVLARGFPRRCMKLRDDILGDITRTDITLHVCLFSSAYLYIPCWAKCWYSYFDTFKFYTWLSIWIISAFSHLQASYSLEIKHALLNQRLFGYCVNLNSIWLWFPWTNRDYFVWMVCRKDTILHWKRWHG